MANKLAVNLDPFIKTQTIYIYEDGSTQSKIYATAELDRIGETLAALAGNHGVDEVCIFGPTKLLAQPIHDFRVYSETIFKEKNENVRLIINGEIFNK
jgi:hypothetical protein